MLREGAAEGNGKRIEWFDAIDTTALPVSLILCWVLLVLVEAGVEDAADVADDEEDEAAAASEAASASGLRSPCIVEQVSREVLLLLPSLLLLIADVDDVAEAGSSSSEMVALVRVCDKKSVGHGAMVGK